VLLDGVRDAVVEKLPADVAVVRLSRPSSSLSRSLENEDEEVAITRELFLKVNLKMNDTFGCLARKGSVNSIVAGLSGSS
jgi:hypothetical protein